MLNDLLILDTATPHGSWVPEHLVQAP